MRCADPLKTIVAEGLRLQAESENLQPSAFSLQPRGGQALVEMAIIGGITLVAVGFLIQIGLRMSYQQEIEQQAFRQALRIAEGESNDRESQATSVMRFRDRHVPDPSQGVAITPRVSTQGGATVTWGRFLTFLADDHDSQPRIVVQVNDTRRDFRSGDFDDGDDHAPFVKHIHKDFQMEEGTTTQRQEIDGLPIQTELLSRRVETTQLTLKNDDTVSSTQASECHFVGEDWRCEED